MSDATRYPLTWPAGWKRTPYSSRRHSKFAKTKLVTSGVPGNTYTYRRSEAIDISTGLDRLTGELRRLGAQNAIISSNLRLNQDGSINRSQGKMLDDPGVAVYFRLKGKAHALACDCWWSTAENMAALAGHIEALRAVDRYGVGTMEQAFGGYAALPPTSVDWWIVLGVSPDATREQINHAHRELAQKNHPDVGGREDDMARINAARDLALAVQA